MDFPSNQVRMMIKKKEFTRLIEQKYCENGFVFIAVVVGAVVVSVADVVSVVIVVSVIVVAIVVAADDEGLAVELVVTS